MRHRKKITPRTIAVKRDTKTGRFVKQTADGKAEQIEVFPMDDGQLQPETKRRQLLFDPKAFGQLVKAHRGETSARTLAKAIGTSASTLSRVERGYTPDLHTFLKLCCWMEVDMNQLVGQVAKPADTGELLLGKQMVALVKQHGYRKES